MNDNTLNSTMDNHVLQQYNENTTREPTTHQPFIISLLKVVNYIEQSISFEQQAEKRFNNLEIRLNKQ